MASRIVIFAPNWLGDAVMALPAIADVRRSLPAASIAVAARQSVMPLFALVADVDEVAQVDELRGRAFDAALLMPNSFHSALVAYRAGIPERWGYRSDFRAPLLTRAVTPVREGHQIDRYQRLTSALGFPSGASTPQLTIAPAVRASAAALLASAGWNGRAPLVALAPGAAYGGAKRWPPEYFGELACALASDDVVSVLIGSAADVANGREVETAARKRGAVVINMIGGTDLQALAGVLTHVRTLVTNDSGAMHVAAALGVPITAIFGPTRERETAPRSLPTAASARAEHTILTNDVWCRPCMLRECPLDHACMRGVLPTAVLAAARRTL
ncbi:MAG TPA: lipopolysaccharide heptosyltransferase II [Vicinamibacterales bacterium]